MNSIANKYSLPSECEDKILFFAHPTLLKKQKNDIYLHKRLFDGFDEYYHESDCELYSLSQLLIKKKSMTLLHSLPYKFKKRFIVAIEELQYYPHIETIDWLISHWKECFAHINRKSKLESWPFIQHFIDEMYIGQLPQKINFNQFVHIVNDYQSQ
jgi:hypothetical protein